MPDAKAHLIYWPIIAIGTSADLWTKSAVLNWLSDKPYNEYSVIDGLFMLVTRFNNGAAFSLFAGQRFGLVAISAIALLVVLGIFLFGKIDSRVMQVALGLFTAGILGNLYDRAFNDGLVRDFLDFYIGDHHWPAFNVADSMLCIAVALIMLHSIFTKPEEEVEK
jgi:signal peptidase II